MVVKIVYRNGDMEYRESASVSYKMANKEIILHQWNKIILNDAIRSVSVNDDIIYVSQNVREEIKNHFKNTPSNNLDNSSQV